MRRTRALRLALALILVLAVGGIVYALAGGEPAGEVAAPSPSATPASAPSETEAAPTVPSRTVDPEPAVTDGIYAVGSEIKPGAYSTTAGTRACYWARLRSFGQANSIIAQHNLVPGERARVVVEPGDRGFKVSNGCTWRRELPV